MEKKRKKFSSGKWLVMFLLTVLLVAMIVPAFNIITDPYGAFGDPVMQWWAYDMTMNPRLAKATYLEQNHEKFDSYVVGASGSSMLSAEALNGYLDASFYNTFFYYSDAESFRQMADFLLNNYEVKNIVLNLSILSATTQTAGEELTKEQYWKVDGSSPLSFYAEYLFITPQQGIQKLDYKKQDDYLQRAFKNINPDTGEYDKSRLDVEGIHDLQPYLKLMKKRANGDFENYNVKKYTANRIEECMEEIRTIKAHCEKNGVNLIVLCQPMYYKYMSYFPQEDQAAFFDALAQVTDYWDFTLSSLSRDPRYFYDTTHARNYLGKMMLAKVFGDETLAVPDDFGRYVEQGSAPGAPVAGYAAQTSYTVKLPILRYCELVEGTPQNEDQLSAADFAAQMYALADAGYTPVDIWEIQDYVLHGGSLPERPVLITFDDGYESCYTLAYPILKELGFKASFFPIGVSMGKDTYKDTGIAITPHFSLEQAQEMTASGLITVGSHGYDIHEIEGLDPSPIREGANQRESGETEEEYVAFLTEDVNRMRELLGEAAGFFSYPYDNKQELPHVILTQAGTFATLYGQNDCTTVIRYLPQSLYAMRRLFVRDGLTPEALIERLEAVTGPHAPAVKEQPADFTAAAGETAVFTVTASGTEPLSYQWQQLKVGETQWVSLGEDGNAAELSVIAYANRDGRQYRCVITSDAGSVTTEPATLTVKAETP